MIYQLAVAVSVVAVASASTLYSENHATQKSLWENFKVEHNRKYDTMEEETKRFYTFVENLKVADQRNLEEKKAGGTAKHGITKFSDWSQVEFETRMLTSDPSKRIRTDSDRTVGVPATVAATGVKDWSGILTTDVKDQGYCGSCWAFSATEQIESDYLRTNSLPASAAIVLSPEQITQCDQTSSGCEGGWTEHAYNYVKRAGGLESNDDYPYSSYQGVTGTCNEVPSKYKVGVTGYTTISGETAMSNYVLSTGPLSVCVDAARWNSYRGGIVTSCGNRVDHCVQAVGVDTSSHWIVRNSWGTSWGEGGYIWLKYGQDTCAISSDPTWVAISK